ncbi:MAG: S-adenosylmethionine uptake transporter [Saliniramus fredricksonii]|uniref:EamA domain-containing membrane protein RarD n=1 Tax=Saliniramus fredricksonii TaxID=1653334 RepID=A0A0P7YBU3_9HYPH|nr:DMT family transporter [Saliniramus fredricksonii]KPQ11518.1 MAG: S-adenosylmethionine uptake transporter [Saliniramus fredricksonii]SCC82425.1 EamA domain-containing membrane protein RarD [Saliniramus fredricksonii]
MQTASPAAPASHQTGIALMCIGVAFLTVNDAIAKTLTQTYSPLQILFLRNVIALPFALMIALRMGGTGALRSYRPSVHLLRGILWVAGTFLFFTSLRFLQLAEATALIFVAPFFIIALSAAFLGERVGWRRWSAVIAGFIGVLIVVRPGGATFQLASLLPVATAFVYALMMLGSRFVDSRESVWTLLLYLTGTSALLSTVLVPFVWVPVRMEHLWLFVAIALCGTAGITMMTQAFRLAPASIVAPLDYTALLWATLLGWLIWNEMPDGVTFIGAGIIIASGVWVILRERRRRI